MQVSPPAQHRLRFAGAVAVSTLALAAGCNQFFGIDTTALAGADAAIDAVGCSGAPFEAPVPVDGVTGFDPSTSDNALELWHVVNDTDFDVAVATRATPDGAFTGVTRFPYNSSADDTDPNLSADGLVLFFISARTSAPLVYESRRASLAEPFGPPVVIPALSATRANSVDVSTDGNTLFVATVAYSPDVSELRVVTRANRDATFELSTEVLATAVAYVSVSPDQRELFYDHPAPSAGGTYRRVRASSVGPFDGPEEVVNLGVDDPDISPSSELLYVDTPASDILVSHRTCR